MKNLWSWIHLTGLQRHVSTGARNSTQRNHYKLMRLINVQYNNSKMKWWMNLYKWIFKRKERSWRSVPDLLSIYLSTFAKLHSQRQRKENGHKIWIKIGIFMCWQNPQTSYWYQVVLFFLANVNPALKSIVSTLDSSLKTSDLNPVSLKYVYKERNKYK